jgi:hypothetical protein
MLFQNLKMIGEELSEICVLFCKYIYIFIYTDDRKYWTQYPEQSKSFWGHLSLQIIIYDC